jgi:hypothetical protein
MKQKELEEGLMQRAYIQHREDTLVAVIEGLIKNIRKKNEKYGNEYLGGMTVDIAITKLKEIGIDCE